MMKNSLVASMEFYFKGEKYSPSVRIDLDRMMETRGELSPFVTLLARENGIDLYSYQYEIMEMEEIHFTEVEGFVADFIHNGVLDFKGFAEKWREEKVLSDLAGIARRCMGVEALADQPELKSALLEAYQQGQKAPQKPVSM